MFYDYEISLKNMPYSEYSSIVPAQPPPCRDDVCSGSTLKMTRNVFIAELNITPRYFVT